MTLIRHSKARYRLLTLAHAAVRDAVAIGILGPLDGRIRCTDCARPARDYDHRDYHAPLTVEPVCRGCNRKRGPAIPIDTCSCDACVALEARQTQAEILASRVWSEQR